MRAFTLVELVIAIAIIAVLTLIALGSYQRYQDKANVMQAVADIGNLQMMIKTYELNNAALPDDLAQIGQAGKLDPWGHPYAYVNLSTMRGNGAARKDRKLNPLNSDYDLYSLGKDGNTKPQITQKDSLDDVIRARDGAFIGQAKDF